MSRSFLSAIEAYCSAPQFCFGRENMPYGMLFLETPGGSALCTDENVAGSHFPLDFEFPLRPPSDPAMRSYVREYASLGAGRRRCAVYCSTA